MHHHAGGDGRSRRTLTVGGLARPVLVAMLLLAALAVAPAIAQPTFPSSGYQTILVDPEDPAVPDNIDIVSLGYQADATYAYFKITVAGAAGFASDRYYLHIDIDDDGLADRLLRNTSAANATLYNWDGSSWVSYGSAWSEDPNDTPDDHVYLACNLSDINGGDFVVVSAAEDQPKFDDTVRDPHTNPDVDEVTDDSSSNPSPVVVSDFRVRCAKGKLRLTWRAAVAPNVAGFNVYALRGGKRGRSKLNRKLIPGRSRVRNPRYMFTCAAGEQSAEQYQLEVVGLDGTVVATVLASPHEAKRAR